MQTKSNVAIKQQTNSNKSKFNKENNVNYKNNKNAENNKGNNRFNNNRNNDRFNDRNNDRNNKMGRNNNYQNRYGNKRPLDEKGIEKNIKNIMSTEVVEKETVREYNRNIDKQKNNNKFDETRGKKAKSRKNQNNNFDEGKLKTLKQANRLSNMFDEQDGGMLDYYDLTTQRGRRGKKKAPKENEERNKQIQRWFKTISKYYYK